MEYDFFSTYLVDRVIPTNLAKLIIWIIINRSELSENVTSKSCAFGHIHFQFHRPITSSIIHPILPTPPTLIVR